MLFKLGVFFIAMGIIKLIAAFVLRAKEKRVK